MTAAALRRAPGRQSHDTVPSFMLALAMHAALFAWLWVAVQWHTSATAPVTAELWDLPAPVEPAPEPAPVVEAPPPPPPPAEAPSPPKPEITEQEEAPKRHEAAPPVEAPPKKKSKPAPPKPSAQELRREQQLAAKEHEEEMRRLTAQAASTTGPPVPATSGPVSNAWIARVQAAVRAHLAYAVPEGVGPDVYAEFLVQLLPTGEQATEPQLVKPSGLAGFDEAARRAIIRTDPFPRKDDGTVPASFRLRLYPQEGR